MPLAADMPPAADMPLSDADRRHLASLQRRIQLFIDRDDRDARIRDY